MQVDGDTARYARVHVWYKVQCSPRMPPDGVCLSLHSSQARALRWWTMRGTVSPGGSSARVCSVGQLARELHMWERDNTLTTQKQVDCKINWKCDLSPLVRVMENKQGQCVHTISHVLIE